MKSPTTQNAHLAILTDFRRFLARCRTLSELDRLAAPDASFTRFVERVRPLLMRELQAGEEEFRKSVRALADYYTPHDLLRVARIAGDEDRYTEFIAWALNGAGDVALAAAIQRDWLRRLGVPASEQPADVRTQVSTDDGRPDIVLVRAADVVVVEAKTGQEEHPTPSGRPQTEGYGPAVGRRFGRPTSACIFLTPDGRAAVAVDGISATYVQLAASLAVTLSELGDRSDHWPYQLLITHLMTSTGPPGVNWSQALTDPEQWLGRTWPEEFPFERFGALHTLFRQLFPTGVPLNV